MIRFLPLFLLLALALTLNACRSITPEAEKRARCNMLKSDLIFNGQTSITRDANLQNAETPLDQRQYHADGCDEG